MSCYSDFDSAEQESAKMVHRFKNYNEKNLKFLDIV